MAEKRTPKDTANIFNKMTKAFVKSRPDVKSTHQLNILYVEDDEDDKIFFEYALNSLDNPPSNFIAKDYLQMQDLLEAPILEFNMIFLDINLPKKSGHECLQIIKGYEKHKNTPVIIFSGSNSPYDIDKMFSAGANYYIIKPTNQSEYISLFEKLFKMNWESANVAVDLESFVLELQ